MGNRRRKEDIVRTEMMGDHLIPFYRIITSEGLEFEVPKHIRRIVSRSKGKVTARGWQIAYNRKDHGVYNPFFNDGESGPWLSLERAINDLRRFLGRTPNTRQSGLRLRESKLKIYSTGIPGIRLEWRLGKRNALYDLKVEARAGMYHPNKAKLIYVGTEFSASEERLRAALNEALKFRRQHYAYAAANGQTFPKIRKQPRLNVTIEQAYSMLEERKARHSERLDQLAIEKADRWMSQKRLYMTFRGYRFTAKRKSILNMDVKVPEFVWIEGNRWHCDYPLPDGGDYLSDIPMSENPVSDITRLMADCFLESMMTSIPAPVDRLFGNQAIA